MFFALILFRNEQTLEEVFVDVPAHHLGRNPQRVLLPLLALFLLQGIAQFIRDVRVVLDKGEAQ